MKTYVTDAVNAPQRQIVDIPIAQILPKGSVKQGANHARVLRKAEQIQKYGLFEPTEVCLAEENGILSRYRICGDDLIWHAACMIGLAQIPCVICPKEAGNPQKIAFLAQICQKDVHFFDKAAACRLLGEKFGMSSAEIASACGVSQSAIANKLRLLQLEPTERQQIRHAALSERHARSLLRLKEREKRSIALQVILQNALTVAKTEELVENVLQEGTAMAARGSKTALNAHESLLVGKRAPFEGSTQNGAFLPRKFAMQSPLPLYNSLERVLNIFRKTGRNAYMNILEREGEVVVEITIPKNR